MSIAAPMTLEQMAASPDIHLNRGFALSLEGSLTSPVIAVTGSRWVPLSIRIQGTDTDWVGDTRDIALEAVRRGRPWWWWTQHWIAALAFGAAAVSVTAASLAGFAAPVWVLAAGLLATVGMLGATIAPRLSIRSGSGKWRPGLLALGKWTVTLILGALMTHFLGKLLG